MPDYISLVPLFSALILLFLFSYVFGQQQCSNTSRSFLAYSGGMCILCLMEFLLYFPFSHNMSLLLFKIAFVLYFIISFMYLLFVYSVSERKVDGYIAFFIVFTGVVSIISFFVPHHIIDVTVAEAKNGIVPTRYYLPFLVLTGGITIRSMYVSFRGYTKGRSAAIREQSILIFWGTAASVTFVTLALALLPVLNNNFTIYPYTSLSTVINGLFVYWAISRHGLMKIDTIRLREVSEVLFQHLKEGVIISDQSGSVVQLNQAALTIVGMENRSIHSVHELSEVCDIDFTKCFSPVKKQCMVRGGRKTLIVANTNIGNATHSLGRMTFLRDFTEQQKYEEQMAQKVQLESLGRLAGGVAHDFNNQLTGILGCADLLKDTVVKNRDAVSLAETIINAAERSAQLTRQMLDFSRKGKYQNVALSINDILADVTLMLEHSIDKRIKISLAATPDSTVVMGDPGQLHNVFLNIALNSRDAMPDGGDLVFSTKQVPVCQEIIRQLPEGDYAEKYVMISIHDSGEGIPEPILQKIFEPFFTTKAVGKGCGMGLAAVYGSVQAHRGAITVGSDPGKGTKFNVYLPAVGQLSEHTPEDTGLPARGSGRHVLVVDDEKNVAVSTRRILRAAGYRSTVSHTGRNAIEHFRNGWNDIDLVILDIMLPDLTGREVFDELKRINPDTAVLLFSGYTHDDQIQKVLESGASGFLQKPFQRKDLLKMVERALSEKHEN